MKWIAGPCLMLGFQLLSVPAFAGAPEPVAAVRGGLQGGDVLLIGQGGAGGAGGAAGTGGKPGRAGKPGLPGCDAGVRRAQDGKFYRPGTTQECNPVHADRRTMNSAPQRL